MKLKAAKIANAALLIIASLFVFTNTATFNRPETPEELLKK
ncbi:cyclic lactone autoinducer peptide [Paenibacillus cremeus]|uniref:Cyclic lactone autoinducer peptide n=1 Tax=Paenibacillus cremeus TaxID=2163881 RepID=A0A559K3K9_9BACL|nr:cyclic lactone autoinducer peptide [Paenibacillus cremeus]TVY06696.1 cyclic lactone autoinducer peptide [Paenibacillus cremeus]